jgi:uncharacterized protein
MRFRPGARLDTGQVQDRRGGGGRGLAVGGGAGTIVIVIVLALLGVNVPGSGTDPYSLGTGSDQPATDLSQTCKTGSDANQREDCRIVGVVNSVQAYWGDNLDGYREAPTRFFSGQTSTGCGSATSAVGPFYCPADQTVFIDLSFYDELRSRFGASGGPLAEMYVVAHEWGHHIQNITGTMNGLDLTDQGPTSDGVRLELQADCYAGASINALSTTPDENGVPFLVQPTDAEIADALNAAAAVGDDHIQETMGGGQVNPETWTHGSSESRQRWFNTGYTQGVGACDTFAAAGSEL